MTQKPHRGTETTLFTLPLEVRDYECDLQGIVNNAVYQHYLEHARHQVLRQHGLSFDELNKTGVHLVVVRAEIEYKSPLRSGDQFVVESRLARLSPVRFAFLQNIYRTTDGSRGLILSATIICAAMNASGRPMFPKVLEPLLNQVEDAGSGSSGTV